MSIREIRRHELNNKNKIRTQSYDRLMPNLELQGYKCELCESFTQSAKIPYHKALAQQGEHNKEKHQSGQISRLMMVYKI